MIAIPIPSKECPYCRKPKGNCRMLVNELQTLRTHSMKSDEKDFRAHMEGQSGPDHREAYVSHAFICMNGDRK